MIRYFYLMVYLFIIKGLFEQDRIKIIDSIVSLMIIVVTDATKDKFEMK